MKQVTILQLEKLAEELSGITDMHPLIENTDGETFRFLNVTLDIKKFSHTKEAHIDLTINVNNGSNNAMRLFLSLIEMKHMDEVIEKVVAFQNATD